jgi:two-component system, response regulator, stage 0 sporulation protein A
MNDNPRRTVLALSDKLAASAILNAAQSAGLLIEALCWDGPETVQKIDQTMPDLVIIDQVLPHWDALESMRRIGLLPLFTMPYVIALSPVDMGFFEKLAIQRGACGVLRKPLNPKALTDLLTALNVESRLPRTDLTEDQLLTCLWSLGFSAKLPGTVYLSAAAMLLSLDIKLMQSLTGRLYPMVARRYGVCPLNVEHAMRRAIESAWSGSAMDRQHALFGNTIDARRGKPTAGEMIGRLAELARVKEL